MYGGDVTATNPTSHDTLTEMHRSQSDKFHKTYIYITTIYISMTSIFSTTIDIVVLIPYSSNPIPTTSYSTKYIYSIYAHA